MRKGLSKLTSALAGLIALVGMNAGNVQAASPQIPTDKAPLVLEHGSVFHAPDAGSVRGELNDHSSHYSHSSHKSHYSHYSSRY
jgi:hypothetical protein